MGLSIKKVATPEALPSNFDEPTGQLQGRTVKLQTARPSGLFATITSIFTNASRALGQLLYKAVKYTLPASCFKQERATASPKEARIARIADFYLRNGNEVFGAIETSAAHFEDVEGLQRGTLLGNISELAKGLARETLEIGDLVSKEQFRSYLDFAGEIAGLAGNENGSLTAVTKHSRIYPNQIPMLDKRAPRPVIEFHAKVVALKGLIDALKTLDAEGPRTMAEQASKLPSAALSKAYSEMKGHIAYVDRKAAIKPLVEAKQVRAGQRAQRKKEQAKQEELEQQRALQRQQELDKKREAYRAQLAKMPKRTPSAQKPISRHANRPVSRPVYKPAHQPTYNPISSYEPDDSPRTIRDCVRLGLDPHEVLGTREVNRQLDAIERKSGSTEKKPDFNERRGYY